MCHDRLDGDDIALTHEFRGMMLGSRRAGVTEALHILEGNGLVRATRGLVVVINRAGLEALAGASYGSAENEYRRLIGAMPRDSINGKLTSGISNASDAVA
jgi:DNA-binding transcriptional regulator YhcF (GntR family)